MHIVIIGNGIAGITAARYIRKLSDYDITVVSAESDHFYSRTALMYLYMGHMTYSDIKPYEDFFWDKNRITLVRAYAQQLDTRAKRVQLSTGLALAYDKLILATGSKSNTFEWPGQDFQGVQGLYGLPDLAIMEQVTKNVSHAVVVGGGLIGIEMAEMLQSRHIAVTMLVREPYNWSNILPDEEAMMVTRQLRAHGIDMRLSTQLTEILGDDRGRVRAVVTDSGEELACHFVGLAVGVHPNTDLAKTSDVVCEAGVLVNDYLETSIQDVYAVGDCAQHREPLPGRQAVEQVWYTGKIQGATVAKTICGHRTRYTPGHWYNSAKFFDIEYQTYGVVPNRPGPQERSVYWEHANGRKSIRIVYDSARDNVVVGFNLMGVRFRHDVCNRWLSEGRDIEHVLKHLDEARFDPEMSNRYEKDVRKVYAKMTGAATTQTQD